MQSEASETFLALKRQTQEPLNGWCGEVLLYYKKAEAVPKLSRNGS
jgi:hypothetical protein